MEARGPLSVLHVSQPTEGGVARYVADLVADQVRRGWAVAVASPWYGDLAPELAAAGAKHIEWSAERAPRPGAFVEARRLARIVDREQPEIVHLHSSKAGLTGRLALRGRLPTIFQPHGWSFDAVTGLLRAGTLTWERLAGRWATVILCVSEAERRRGEAHGVRANWRIVPNGVDLAAFAQAPPEETSAAKLRLGLDERPVVVCVGRLCREKGQDVLLDAWPAVLTRVPDAQLVLVGDGPYTEAMRRRARDGVKLVGKRRDVPDWLAAADVVAFPSRSEGMSVGMLEAMARGRAVVASDVGGAAEALGGEAGALVPPEDPTALAEAIAQRLLDPVGAATAARAARRRAELYHDLATTTGAVAGLYEELVSSSTGPKLL